MDPEKAIDRVWLEGWWQSVYVGKILFLNQYLIKLNHFGTF